MLLLRARVYLVTMAMKEYSAFPEAPTSQEPHYQRFRIQSVYSTTLTDGDEIVKCHIQDTRLGSLTLPKRYSRCILQPQPTGLTKKIDNE